MTHAFSRLSSWTEVRADSGLLQKPASACCDSRTVRRPALAGRSKEVSELEDPVLQLGQALDEIGHAANSASRDSGTHGNERAARPPAAEERLVERKYSRAQKIWRPPARISLSASLKYGVESAISRPT